MFFCNDTATTEIYTLSLHDALPISPRGQPLADPPDPGHRPGQARRDGGEGRLPQPVEELRRGRGWRLLRRDGVERPDRDRKSTRLNSSHANISYAVFCLKKKKHSTN